MIQSFTVTNHNGKSIVCELANPWKEGLAVASIDGLGPGQATINVADISSMDGGLFNSARKGPRNIVFNLIFVDHDTLTIEDIRRKCYTYFPIKKNVKLKFTTSDGKTNKEYFIDGYVESNEPVIFSSQEGATVSVICPKPYFYRANPQEQVFNASADPNFVFGAYDQEPYFWRDGTLTEEEQTKLRMGDIVSFVISSLVYEGTADAGLVFEILFKSDVSYNEETQRYIQITNSLTNTRNRISLNKIYSIMDSNPDVSDYTGIVEGDKLIFSTVKGEKYLTYIHDNISYNMLSAVEAAANGEWVYLTEGLNVLGIYKDSDVEISASSKNKIYFYGV